MERHTVTLLVMFLKTVTVENSTKFLHQYSSTYGNAYDNAWKTIVMFLNKDKRNPEVQTDNVK